MNWGGYEKRRFVRGDFFCKIIISTPKQRELISHTENIAEGGVRVILEEELEVNSMVDLEIYISKMPIVGRGRVAWVVPEKNPITGEALLYDTGIEFFGISDEDRLVIKNIVDAIVEGNKSQ